MQNSNSGAMRGEDAGLDYTTLKLDIAARLRKVCADWSRQDFDEVVEKVTLMTLKFPPEKLRR